MNFPTEAKSAASKEDGYSSLMRADEELGYRQAPRHTAATETNKQENS